MRRAHLWRVRGGGGEAAARGAAVGVGALALPTLQRVQEGGELRVGDAEALSDLGEEEELHGAPGQGEVGVGWG